MQSEPLPQMDFAPDLHCGGRGNGSLIMNSTLGGAMVTEHAPRRWQAELALGYARRDGRTVLARRSHSGPLRVQRDLYPEGDATCHNIVVHPPGGIAGGDTLSVNVRLETASEALLTTPGATKWYRSDGLPAGQTLVFELERNSVLEWLPQETIVFNGACAEMSANIRLAEGAAYLGWEVLCLGRAAAGERFASGHLRMRTEIWRMGARLWAERAQIEGGDPLLASPVGLRGRSVSAIMLAAGPDIPAEVIAACRRVQPGAGAESGITQLPHIAVARYLGDSGEDARRYFAALWAQIRPALKGCPAVEPRVWAT